MRVLVPIAGCAIALAALAPACASAPARPPEVVHAEPPRETPAGSSARYDQLVRGANDRVTAADYAGALAIAGEALSVRPFGLAAGLAKIEAHLMLGQRTEALDFAERLHERHPRRVEPDYARGKALYALGRFSDARAAFEEGLGLAPDDRPSLVALLTVLAHDPTIPLAELEARADELTAPPSDYAADALHALAIAHEIRADPAGAEALYLRAIALRPLHPFAHYNLARLRQASSGMPAARADFQAFLDQAPPSAAREVEIVHKLLEETPP